jgi:pyruvate dehydrogenase E1 component
VVVVTSYDRLWRAVQARRGLLRGPRHAVDEGVLDRAFGRRTPLVTVLDGHPHTLAFLGGVTGTPVSCLGVSVFGQGGGVDEVHAYHGLDARSIVEAALDLVD